MDENVQDVGDEIHAAFHGSGFDIHGRVLVVAIDNYFKNTCVVIGNMIDSPELLVKEKDINYGELDL